MIWHSATAQQVAEELQTNVYKGLTSAEVADRLRRYGANALRDKKRRSLFQILLSQLKSTTLLVVLAAAAVWLITGLLLKTQNYWGALVIFAIALLSVVIGMIQESVSESALDSLRNRSQPSATVLREGQTITLPATELVPGDILLLQEGDYIPADARLLQSNQLRCDESALTGEPVSVEKDADALLADIVPLEQRSNIIYSGCTVSHGNAKAAVVATGLASEAAKIAAVVDDSLQIVTPLQRQWKNTLGSIGKAAGIISGLVFILAMLLTDGSLFDRFANTFMTCAALAAAAIPEGLTATITVILAVGVQRMVRRKVLVRSLSAVETLGAVSIVCTDKTGTLTQNHMTMTHIFGGKELLTLQPDLVLNTPTKDLLLMGAMCCDADVKLHDGEELLIGDHTEAGIVAALQQYTGIDKQTVDSMYPRLCVLPFDSQRKLKTSVNMIDGKPVAVVKGAPDIIISRCNGCDQKTAIEASRAMAKQALRVIGIAFKPLTEAPANPTQAELEHDLIFGGLVGLADPPIPEAEQAVASAKTAGIKVVMMTGDHVSTAVASARSMGIMTQDTSVITNEELESLTDAELDDLIDRFTVYVRLLPDNKVRVLEALHRKGYVTAVTGDSVADVPALRMADIGCAMGNSGTDAAKGAAEITITDDNFATIIGGIRAGRGIYENVCKTIRFTLGCVLGLLLTMLAGIVCFQQLPFNAVQILWLHLLILSIPILTLGLEQPSPGLMTQPPRSGSSILEGKKGMITLLQGLLLMGIAIGSFIIGRRAGAETAVTMAFGSFGFAELLCAFSARSPYSLMDFKQHCFNYWLFLGSAVAAGLLIAVMAVPSLRVIFGLVSLNAVQKRIVTIAAFVPFIVLELFKLPSFFRSFGKKS